MIEKILNEKITIKEIVFMIIPWGLVAFLSYREHNTESRLIQMQESLVRQTEIINKLQNDLTEITNTLNMTLAQNALYNSTGSQLLVSQTETNQFYLKFLGIGACAIIVCIICSNAYPALFSVKNLVPTYIFNIIQTYTPFFQTRDTYVSIDTIAQLEWLVNIQNNKHMEILVKPLDSLDYIKAGEYILSLQLKTTNVMFTNPPIVNNFTADQTAAVMLDVSRALGLS